MLSPRSVAVRASVAHALVVARARAVAGAAVGAVSLDEREARDESDEDLHG